MTFAKYLNGVLSVAVNFFASFGAGSAQTAQQKQQFDQIKQEYHALKIAYLVDQDCNLLGSVSRQNAYSKSFELSQSMRQFGITFDQLKAFDKGVEDALEGKTCNDLANEPNIKLAKSVADLVAGMNIFIWQAYYEKHPDGAPWREDCGGGYLNDLIKDSTADQDYLVGRFKSSSQFSVISANMDKYIQQIHQVCQTDGAFFKMTYGGNSLYKIVKHTIEVHNHLKPGKQRGTLEIVDGAQRWRGFRGATARNQFDSDVPWVVLREAREKNVTGSGIRSTFFENSSVNYGLTPDRQFVVSIRAPSMGDFDTRIFKAVILTNTDTGKTWRLEKTSKYFKAYSPEVMSGSNIKPGDPPHTVQFTMPKTDSQNIIDAIGADQKIKVQVERLEEGKSRLVDVETIKRQSFEGAVKYAFAPKIEFANL